MDVCSLEEIQNLFIFYDTCFSKYFPELELVIIYQFTPPYKKIDKSHFY